MDRNTNAFIMDLIHKCISNGVTIYWEARMEYITLNTDLGDVPCSGYFNDDTDGDVPELAVAMGGGIQKWLPVLVHESCHLDQWLEKSPLWTRHPLGDPAGLIDDWINGEEFEPEVVDTIFKENIALELDCEQRSVKKILENHLPIDIDTYIQKANAYLMFYLYCKKHRTWSDPKHSPYQDAISEKLLTTWYDSYEVLPQHIEKLFDLFMHGTNNKKPL